MAWASAPNRPTQTTPPSWQLGCAWRSLAKTAICTTRSDDSDVIFVRLVCALSEELPRPPASRISRAPRFLESASNCRIPR